MPLFSCLYMRKGLQLEVVEIEIWMNRWRYSAKNVREYCWDVSRKTYRADFGKTYWLIFKNWKRPKPEFHMQHVFDGFSCIHGEKGYGVNFDGLSGMQNFVGNKIEVMDFDLRALCTLCGPNFPLPAFWGKRLDAEFGGTAGDTKLKMWVNIVEMCPAKRTERILQIRFSWFLKIQNVQNLCFKFCHFLTLLPVSMGKKASQSILMSSVMIKILLKIW